MKIYIFWIKNKKSNKTSKIKSTNNSITFNDNTVLYVGSVKKLNQQWYNNIVKIILISKQINSLLW